MTSRAGEARAELFAQNGALVAVVLVNGSDPPAFVLHDGRRFDRAGTAARLHDDGVEFVAYDYAEVEPDDD